MYTAVLFREIIGNSVQFRSTLVAYGFYFSACNWRWFFFFPGFLLIDNNERCLNIGFSTWKSGPFVFDPRFGYR